MGYYTTFTLKADREVNEKEILHKLAEISGISFFGDLENFHQVSWECMKWYNYADDMVKLSEVYPDVLFEVEGQGEEYEDVWKHYFKNGLSQFCQGYITFEPYNPEKLKN